MVKLICDRCKKDIEENYYVINFWEYDTNPHYESVTTAYASAYSSPETRVGALKMLNAQKMYCKKCKCEIENFIG